MEKKDLSDKFHPIFEFNDENLIVSSLYAPCSVMVRQCWTNHAVNCFYLLKFSDANNETILLFIRFNTIYICTECYPQLKALANAVKSESPLALRFNEANKCKQKKNSDSPTSWSPLYLLVL